MTCGTYVKYITKKRKGSGKEYTKVQKYLGRWLIEVLGVKPEEDMVLCDGKIIAKIRAVDKPDWGCTYAELEAEYECEKCGYTFSASELPRTEEDISVLLTRALEVLDRNDPAVCGPLTREAKHYYPSSIAAKKG